MGKPRADDFAERREHLAHLTEEQLEERFWSLANEVVEPLLDLARTHTSPSIERSVLLRMGFDSLTARGIAEQAMAHGLLGHGAGHLVWRYAKGQGLGIEAAGLALARGEGWDSLESYFGPREQ
ncbi:D-ornithine 4,5-aminomutase alpha-subunit [Acididesulfobacillus acetoxydans]|uniref:Cobalamin (Vitamin B12)-dependent enzyme, catalytic n=1 Tax=Acididesulfobacillus acetoxydans TaxID=1561005 RepID=A0A8S0XVB9_9FIRM|nr:ornithine aminomutase subunit alpha [Acididesulfobacillus acetoxydans]CAA7600197.1 D-ornithine 4,5-aminomutase alpha-subunit [Acididesulfobacillus acetoxydans]CEJ09575.1 Cobalamin (vitamin B12)-dependent enzyme, catalytic [Acididesulfobacillus acetoxydans]